MVTRHSHPGWGGPRRNSGGARPGSGPKPLPPRIVGNRLVMSVRHLTEVRRDAFTKAGCTPLIDLQKMRLGTKVKVGGLVADGVRRPPTAKGTAFLRLEERDGLMDVIIPSQVFIECRQSLSAAFVVVEGTLQSKGMTTAIVAKRVMRLN